MYKVLIVDDNENNRMLLRAVLEDYAEEDKETELIISEAVNGAEAVMMAQNESYALILMDIMMPEMDGIEATRQIRAQDSKVMIIAVSAVDDTARQSEILAYGAEDYISKPVKMDIFRARLGNYFALIHSRLNPPKRFNPSPANLYSSEIFSRKFLFYVQNDDELAEFWEYYLLNQENGSEEMSAAVRTLYALGSVGLKLHMKFQIITEEGDAFIYMTLVGIDQIDAKIVKLVLLKNPDVTDYKIEERKLTIRIPRLEKTPPKPLTQSIQAAPAASIPSVQPAEAQAPASVYVAKEEVLTVYDYMDEEDLNEIKGYISNLGSLLLLVGSGDIQRDEVADIATTLSRIGKVATTYSDSYAIGHSLIGLSDAIHNNIDLFIAKSGSLGALCGAFSRDLMSWIRMTFEEGAPSVDFMNDTIMSNAQMISSFLNSDDTANHEAVDLDDIFDF